MSYSLLLETKKNELKAYRAAEEILFLERFPRARFETEWNMDKCVSSIHSFIPTTHPNLIIYHMTYDPNHMFGGRGKIHYQESSQTFDSHNYWR